ncbi:helix-turn-helix transcriptional regulator [Starkeya sp. ORNL1]|uniref:helix-turn-helix domain-containing protein n=1 Tax=Starkeya sp. ORNL1 TaxID=2709380 RepID=UPI001462C04D|nr:AraC family transcriptional regulator [Starkeya sp. ORNL1]QJP16132.1 helix-turn-helix transcriptional regulator [Starkeya sp. ORNL1]
MPVRATLPIHYGRQADGMGLYYHASRDLEEREPHGHEEIQVTIPLLSRRPPDRVACGPIEVIPSYGEHATTWGGSRELVIIHFAAEFLAHSVEQRVEFAGRGIKVAKDDPFISRIGVTIRDEIHSTGDVETVLLTTLGTILAGYIYKGVSHGGGKPSAEYMTFEQTRRAVELINDAVGRQLSLYEIASTLGLSQWHFARQFRKTTGLSPYQFFMRARVERARGLLEDGCSISEAAVATGFADQSHLHRYFIRYTGKTPGDVSRGIRRS